jgi:hypothetical protein
LTTVGNYAGEEGREEEISTVTPGLINKTDYLSVGRGYAFFRNVGSLKIYAAPHPRRQHSLRCITASKCRMHYQKHKCKCCCAMACEHIEKTNGQVSGGSHFRVKDLFFFSLIRSPHNFKTYFYLRKTSALMSVYFTYK